MTEKNELYRYEYEGKTFRVGGLDQKIGLDRYSIQEFDPSKFTTGDSVLFEGANGPDKRIGKIVGSADGPDGTTFFEIKDLKHGYIEKVPSYSIFKPRELHPEEWWNRWSEAMVSMEDQNFKKWRNEYRWLFDGFRFSPGGRIMLALGQEYLNVDPDCISRCHASYDGIVPKTEAKSKLTMYNCFVGKSPRGPSGRWEYVDKSEVYGSEEVENLTVLTDLKLSILQFMNVLESNIEEVNVMKHGGGYGINVSKIETVSGPAVAPESIVIYFAPESRDYPESRRSRMIGKLGRYTVLGERALGAAEGYDFFEVEDSIEGIFDGIRRMISNAFSGVKTCVGFNRLRHRGAILKKINGRSSGAVVWAELYEVWARLLSLETVDVVEFLETYSKIVNSVMQGGSRRGALMLLLDSYRLDVIDKFVSRKKELDKMGKGRWLTGSNISVAVDEHFMALVESFKKKSSAGLEPGTAEKRVARVWSNIIQSAWASAEPGIVWLDRYNRMSNSYYYNEIAGVNPCAEQGLPEHGVCNLAHINLVRFQNSETGAMNWVDLRRAVKLGIRAQDNFIDYSHYFSEDNLYLQKGERRIGQGTLGLATVLINARIRYGVEAVPFIDEIYSRISFWQVEASMELAREKGPFPMFEFSKYMASGHMSLIVENWKRQFRDDPEFDVDALVSKIKKYGVRNVCVSTQAPTGSTGTMLNGYFEANDGVSVSSGIEPFYGFDYYRAGRLGVDREVSPMIKRYFDSNPGEKTLPRWFVTAMELSPADHVAVQAAIQKWVDSSISKTVNCPESATPAEIEEVYLMSHRNGLKGVTVYRDGSRSVQVLSKKKENAKIESHVEAKVLAAIEAASKSAKKPENNFAYAKCPSCGEKAYVKAECSCAACGASVCTM